MRDYFLTRLLMVIPTLIGISLVSFIIIHMTPGDPATLKLGSANDAHSALITAEIIEDTRKLYGLDQPLYVQYWRWLKRVVTLDFGDSLRDHRPIIEKLQERVPVTLKLTGTSLLLAYLIAIPIGIYSSTHRFSGIDKAIAIILFALYSLPSFWLATMAIVYLGGGDFWNVFPVYGLQSVGAENWPFWHRFADQIRHLILPITCLTPYSLAILSRYMRSSMLEVIHQDFIRTARAKGLRERVVIFRHALRNSLIPIVTLMADVLPALIGGSIVIEYIFSIPGMGQLSYEAVLNRDYPMIMAVFTLSALLTLIGIVLTDFLYTVIDPRISYEKRVA